jgi:hypothetical protein
MRSSPFCERFFYFIVAYTLKNSKRLFVGIDSLTKGVYKGKIKHYIGGEKIPVRPKRFFQPSFFFPKRKIG